MNIITIIMLVFSVLGATDRIIGNKFGIGKEFEKGFMLFGVMALSMIGMIVLAPVIATLLEPVMSWVYTTLNLDPSVIPAIVFANDMGGSPLAQQIAKSEEIGMFNALIVSSMMGCTISFTIPYAIGIVKPHQHKDLLLGLLCGIVTIPIGCLVSGFILAIPFIPLLINMLPLVIFSAIVGVGIVFIPAVCVKIFNVFGIIMKSMITIGLVLAVIQFLSGYEIIKGLDTLEAGAMVCLNASAVMSGAFPLMFIISKLLKRPCAYLGKLMGINDVSAVGFISSLATSATTFEMMERMDKKGVILNSAFATSGAFVFAGHLAFTLAFNENYVFPMIIGKIISGICAVVVAILICRKSENQNRIDKKLEDKNMNSMNDEATL